MNKEHQLLNAPLGADSANVARGIIVASNESRFASRNYNEPLTGYVVGWRDPNNLDQLLEDIAPSVSVGRRFEFKKAVNAEAFLTETDDVRAIGSAFKRVEFTGTSVNDKTYNKGLTIRVDHDDVIGDDWRERYTGFLMQRLTRNELRRAIALLVAAANNTDLTLGDNGNFDAQLRKCLRVATGKSGIRPSRALMGGTAWDLRAENYEGQNTPHAGRRADMTPDQLASKLMLEKIIVSEAVYQSSATAKANIVGAIALAYYAAQGLMKDDPSNIKRFVSPTLSGGNRRVYVEEHDKFTDISVEHYSNTIITSLLGIEMLTLK